MRYTFVLTLMFIHSKSFGQFDLFDINAVSENVVMKEILSNKKNKKYVDTTRMRYEDGRIISTEEIKGGKSTVTTTWEYEISDSLEIIKKKGIKTINTIRKNYYDELGRLVKSELHPAYNTDSIMTSQYDFKYNDSNKALSYKQLPMSFGMIPPIMDVKVEYIDEYKSKETLSYISFGRMNTYVSELEYAKDMKSLIWTQYRLDEYQNMKDYRKTKMNTSRNQSKNRWHEVIEENDRIVVKKVFSKNRFLLDQYGNWIGIALINKKGKVRRRFQVEDNVIIHYK